MKRIQLILSILLLLSASLAFSQWTQLGADIDGEAASDLFGISVSLSADGARVAIGATYNDGAGANSGHTRIYQWNGAAWVQLGADINGEAAGDWSGRSVSLSADGARVAIGAPYNDGNGEESGHTRIYQWNGVAWVQLGADIDGEAVGDWSGSAVSLSADGTRVAIGAIGNDGNGGDSGHTRIYQWNGAAWLQLGADLNGEVATDYSGNSVSLSADGARVAIGAYFNDGTGDASGHTRIYEWNGVAWVQLGTDLNGEAAGDRSGYSVSLSADGTRVAIGAYLNDGAGADSGHTRIYVWNGAAWVQLGADLNGEAAGDYCGWSVSLSADGARVAIGAIWNDGAGSSSGHTRLYQWQGGAWVQLGIDIDGEAANDWSGDSVSLSADGARVAIGARYNDGAGAESGHVRLYRFPAPNTALGAGSGANSTGVGNVFLGYRTGYNATTGGSNTFVGSESGYSTTSGSGNLFLGNRAGYAETGSNLLYLDNSDTATPLIWGDFAADALRINGSLRVTNLPQNDALTRVLTSDTDGNLHWREGATLIGNQTFPSYPQSAGDGGANSNAYFGHQAGAVNTGADNTFIGNQSGLLNTSGYENSSLGSRTLENNTTGTRNTANGVYTLFGNTTGNENTAVGYAALGFNSTASRNTAVGFNSLLTNSGSENTATGYRALIGNTNGSFNTALGSYALQYNESGNSNTAIGANAGPTATNRSGTTAIGADALTNGFSATATGYTSSAAGNYAVALGAQANASADYATALGFQASAGHENATAVGYGAATTANNQVRVGNNAVTSIGGYANWSNVSDARFKTAIKEDIDGLAFIEKLRPVSYELDRQKLHTFSRGEDTAPLADLPPAERSVGFIAQEVERVVTENRYVFSGVDKPQNERDHYGIRYAEFVVPLVKAVQELSAKDKAQQQLIEALQQKITLLENRYEPPKTPGSASSKTSAESESQPLPGGFALYQNVPNPFDRTTVIGARVPESVQQAKIVVYNLQGLELASYPLSERGKVSVEISGGRFPAGMYLYALLADGQVIDTKKMILTD